MQIEEVKIEKKKEKEIDERKVTKSQVDDILYDIEQISNLPSTNSSTSYVPSYANNNNSFLEEISLFEDILENNQIENFRPLRFIPNFHPNKLMDNPTSLKPFSRSYPFSL